METEKIKDTKMVDVEVVKNSVSDVIGGVFSAYVAFNTLLTILKPFINKVVKNEKK